MKLFKKDFDKIVEEEFFSIKENENIVLIEHKIKHKAEYYRTFYNLYFKSQKLGHIKVVPFKRYPNSRIFKELYPEGYEEEGFWIVSEVY